ncbi:MAG: 2Fe-2S iron-sulfur cluster-binding protein [Thermodesulfobacteriota bacterium]|nr:2Fe-2S iron-sulfur cluster-binding protein [Thermodesulfobacteriota bacterium]
MEDFHLVIDGIEIIGKKGETVLSASRRVGIYIPTLCFHPNLSFYPHAKAREVVFQGGKPFKGDRPNSEFEGCGLCLVEIGDGQEMFQACETVVSEGMIINTNTKRIQEKRKEYLARLLAKHPHTCIVCPQRDGCDLKNCSSNLPEEERCCIQFAHCELREVAQYIGIREGISRYIYEDLPKEKDNPSFFRNYNLCIGCIRCVRICKHITGTGALGFVFQDNRVIIGSLNPSMKDAGCVFCGSCIEVCPTGALLESPLKQKRKATISIKDVAHSPPLPKVLFPFYRETVETLPESEGVYQLLDERKNVLCIKGTINLKRELIEQLEEQDQTVYFLFEATPMYTQRESELLQQFLQRYGSLPKGNLGPDIDDLFI